MKKISLTLILFIALLFSACEKGNDNFVSSAISDVYIKTIQHEGKTKYALFARTFSNFTIESASVNTPDDENLELSRRNNLPNIFDYYTEEPIAFKETAPLKGEYTFTIKSKDDVTLTNVNVLKEDIAPFPVISLAKITDNILKISWDKSEETDFYILSLYNEDNEIVFSNEFIKDVETISIDANSKGWYTGKEMKDAFSVKLMGAKFDDKEKPSLYLLQSIAESDKEIE